VDWKDKQAYRTLPYWWRHLREGLLPGPASLALKPQLARALAARPGARRDPVLDSIAIRMELPGTGVGFGGHCF